MKDKVKEHLDFFIEWGSCVYSLKKQLEVPKFETEHDAVKYTISIDWVQLMEPTDRDHLNFLKIFFNSLMRGLKFGSELIHVSQDSVLSHYFEADINVE